MSDGQKMLYSICMAVLLFFAFQFGLVYREMGSLDDRKMEVEAQILTKQRLLDEYERRISVKERDVVRFEHRLQELEFRVKSQQTLYFKEKAGDLPVIYVITPTRSCATQIADLIRLSQTLMHVRALHWVVVEDAEDRSNAVAALLKRSRLRYSHFTALTPPEMKLNETNPNWLKPRGVNQRNAGLQWLRRNFAGSVKPAVVYFADDDNTYDLRVFDEMRYTKTVSVWPVGLVGGLLVERPILESGKIVNFMTAWKPNRPFPIDMAAFAVNLKLLLDHPDVEFTYEVPRGYQESHLLQNLITVEDLEPKADLCTKVLVWHTRTEKADLRNERKLQLNGKRPSDDGIEY